MTTITWDFLFIARYHILTVATVVSVLYIVIFNVIPGDNLTPLLVYFEFSDPVMLGFIFIGAMVLFEKDANTLQAVVVSPLKPWQYLWSKAISLSLMATVYGLIIAIAGYGWKFNYLYLIYSLFLTSLSFSFIGFIGVSKVKSFNQYIIIIPLFLAPAALPLLNYFNITNTFLMYIIPTQATLILLDAAFNPANLGQLMYSSIYLVLWVYISYLLAESHFLKYIVRKSLPKN
ncbi:MAG: ABC transporter permease [Bacteroidales bacterium]|nr:ABC transporter permease [Bacteroidales bacterium]